MPLRVLVRNVALRWYTTRLTTTMPALLHHKLSHQCSRTSPQVLRLLHLRLPNHHRMLPAYGITLVAQVVLVEPELPVLVASVAQHLHTTRPTITKNVPDFKIDFLDHVALRVTDLETSAKWYEKVLGLKRYSLPQWQPFPILLLAGKTGIALFPANISHPSLDQHSQNVKIDHFAFQLSRQDFASARAHYEQLGLAYSFQDHHYFHSIYTNDPDGHTVELTTLVVPETDFYGS